MSFETKSNVSAERTNEKQSSSEKQPSTISAATADRTPVRVLHVDDDSAFLDLTATFLEREGNITVESETDPRAAIERVRSNDPAIDCVVSDYRMPERDGLDLLEAIRGIDPDLPFILFTGKGSEAIASEAITAGVTDYLQKGGTETYELLANRIDNAAEQYRSRKRLDRINERFRTLIENGTDVACVLDPDGRYQYVSPAVQSVLGYDPTELIGESAFDRVHPADRERLQNVFDELRRSETSETVVRYRGKDADGAWRWIEAGITDERDSAAEGFVVNARDVTTQVERERDLQSFRTAVENAGHAIYWTDPEGTIEYANPAFESITGYTAEEAVGRQASILQSGEHDNAFYEELWETITGGDVWHGEIVNERADGERYVAAQTIAPILEATDGIDRFVAVTHDVTEHRTYRRRLNALHETTRELIEADSPDAAAEIAVAAASEILDLPISGVHLYRKDRDALVPAARTEAAERSIGAIPTFERNEAIAWDVFEEGTPRVYDDVRNAAGVYNPETAIRSELQVPLGDHGVFLAGSTDSGVFEDRTVSLAIVLCSNLETALDRLENETRLRETTERLRESNERLEAFAGVVSHDLRGPLATARTGVQLARRNGVDDDVFEHIVRAHDRMDALIENLLVLAKEGKRLDAVTSVSIETIANESWNAVETGESILRIEDDRTLQGDRFRLRQLFENLFRNSVEHGSSDPTRNETDEHVDEELTITVGSCPDGFYVEDDGQGIPEADRDRVFDTGYSTSGDGTGLGLSIVNDVVDAHGWEVSILESADGGARFEITGVEITDDVTNVG